jgi:hypothetical protein
MLIALAVEQYGRKSHRCAVAVLLRLSFLFLLLFKWTQDKSTPLKKMHVII